MTVITVPVDDELEAPRADTDPAEAAATVGLGSQAYEALLDLIFSRELKQGDQIQERALATRLGIRARRCARPCTGWKANVSWSASRTTGCSCVW